PADARPARSRGDAHLRARARAPAATREAGRLAFRDRTLGRSRRYAEPYGEEGGYWRRERANPCPQFRFGKGSYSNPHRGVPLVWRALRKGVVQARPEHRLPDRPARSLS